MNGILIFRTKPENGIGKNDVKVIPFLQKKQLF